jgi:rod shape-determining protein MreD
MIRKRPTPAQRPGWILWPMLASVAATLVLMTPLRIAGLSLPEPVFPMVLAFAWAVIRPSVVGPLALLATGLFLDLLWGAPLGLWGLALLLAYGGAVVSRSLVTGRGTLMLLMWYFVLTVIAFTAAYLTIMLRARIAPDLPSVLWQLLATLALFPLAQRLIAFFEDAEIRSW